MMTHPRSLRPGSRAAESRPGPWTPLLLAVAVVGPLLGEVWQSSKLAELSLRHHQIRAAVDGARARLEFLRADLERRTTRAELSPVADELGLKPAELRQVVLVPAAYLAREEERAPEAATPFLAVSERIARALVPDARARGREQH